MCELLTRIGKDEVDGTVITCLAGSVIYKAIEFEINPQMPTSRIN